NCSKKVGRGEFEGAQSARHRPYLNQQQMKNRMLWAGTYKDWTVENWSKVIWSDESNIEMFDTLGAQFVCRRPGEAFRVDCITPTAKHGGGSVMIWGYISANGVEEVFVGGGRMNSERYISLLEEVLEASVLKMYDRDDAEYLFRQDSAPCHKSRFSME
ncbi:hypothetical protein Trydic_g15351, partial [Trypoxylus dichotomus]